MKAFVDAVLEAPLDEDACPFGEGEAARGAVARVAD